jgi:hypothetical protein
VPFTFEIIMCLTLNSAEEWAGSSFQVVTVPGAGVAVVMFVLLLSPLGCGRKEFVSTSKFK